MCILLSCFTPLFYLPLCPKRSLFTDPPSTYLPLSCEKVRERFHTSPLPKSLILLTEVAVQQTLEGLAVAGFVASHLMDGVVDSVEVQCFGTGSDTLLVFACT